METGVKKTVRWALTGALAVLGMVLFVKLLLPALWPFLLAFLTAALCEPAVEFFSEKCHLRRGIASVLCVLTVLSSLVGFFLLVVVRLLDEAAGLLEALPRLTAGLPQVLERVEDVFRRVTAAVPEGARGYMEDALEAAGERAAQIPARLSEWALGRLQSAAAGAPGTILAVATYVIGAFFLSAGFPSVKAFLARQVPDRMRKTVHSVKEDLLDGVGRWLRAEAALVGITFAQLTAAFTVIGVEYGAVIALLTALIDALPVFGAGIVLLPWAAVSFLGGDTARASGLLITYLIVTLVRQCLEPKLIGDQFGVAPAAALLAMYTGFQLCGVAGMALFPFGLMLLNQMNTKGYIKLWK